MTRVIQFPLREIQELVCDCQGNTWRTFDDGWVECVECNADYEWGDFLDPEAGDD